MWTRRQLPIAILGVLPLALPGCAPAGRASLQAVEAAYRETRDLKDQIDVTRARHADASLPGVPLSDLLTRYRAARGRLQAGLTSGSFAGLADDDRRALEAMQRALGKDLTEESGDAPDAKPSAEPACDAAAALPEGPDGLEALSKRMYACFGEAARSVVFEGRRLDRLTVLSLLQTTDDERRRRGLWLSLEPIWKSVNGRGGADSPYRRLVRLNAAQLAARHSSVEAAGAAIGADPARIEEWLVSVLETWRAITPDRPLEPWDFAYAAGKAARDLAPRIPKDALRPLNDRFYADLGAAPSALQVRYDLEPREGKNPVAFTTFGARPRLLQGAWTPGEPWVFATYGVGGLDNLEELLHETGHAVHIAAIRTRPAFEDWPDSDLFTEALADVAALEVYEPAWQRKYLGASSPLSDSLRDKYAGIVMDTAWALFEIRMHRNPSLDPNQVWTEITGRYLRIKPHADRSWWAMRGQLVDLPGYMLNYAAGAILIADLRARTKALHGDYGAGDATWYAWISERLYRFGLERPSLEVIEDFLGRPPDPRALLLDLSRARSGG